MICFLSSITIFFSTWSDNCSCGSTIYKNAFQPLNIVGSYLGIFSLANKSCILIEFTRVVKKCDNSQGEKLEYSSEPLKKLVVEIIAFSSTLHP